MENQIQNTDLVVLESDDMYARYFNLLLNALGKMLKAQTPEADHGVYEAEVTRGFVERLLFTVRALRLKFNFSPAHNKELSVDVSDSGFLDREAITSLETDLRLRPERLLKLQPISILKSAILDSLFRMQTEPRDQLWHLADRYYFELIDDAKLFLPFTPGELVRRKKQREAGDVRSYTYSWACYDFSTNRPYVHVMSFDQDAGELLLEKDEATFIQFLHVVKSAGSRAPDVERLALEIDEQLESIHPKAIKRVCVGPMYSPLLLGSRTTFSSEAEATALSALTRFGRRPDDFMLFSTNDFVFSDKQVARSGFFGKRVRELFHIPDIVADPEANERRASVVHHGVIMPHAVRQNLSAEDVHTLKLDQIKVLTYDEEGEIHGT